MTSIVPLLDDLAFDQLVADNRGLIPRYAPEWTDHNLSDPGITLIDLIAWLTDQQIYRIGFVGDSLRGAFTRLMGIEPRGPEAAELLVWPAGSVPVSDLRAGTQLRTPDALDARFTLTRDVRTVGPAIDDILLWKDGRSRTLGTGLTEGRDPVDLLPVSGGGPAMLEIELDGDVVPLTDAGPVSLGLQLTAEAGGAGWTPARVEQWDEAGGFWHVLEGEDLTRGLRRSGVILFRPKPLTPARRFRLRLDQGFRHRPARLYRLALNVLPASEGVDDRGGEIGEGTGLPYQLVEVETADIVDRNKNLVIETDVGGVTMRWTRTSDLALSGPDDAHYSLTPEGLLFGNGLNGRTVPRGSQILMGPVRRTAGEGGAVTAGLRWTIAGTVFGTNIAASTAGRDRDGLRQLVDRARAASREREGLLSAAAIRAALLGSGLGLADAQVTARRRPGLDDRDTPGARTVLLLPVRDPDTAPGPAPARLRERAERALAPLRLLGERLYVSFPLHAPVDISLALVVDPDADVAALRVEAEARLRARLWDLRRRPDVAPWPAGRAVKVGEIEGLVAELPQVSRVPDCRIARAGRVPGRAAIELGDRGIALAGAIDLRVIRDGTAGAEVIPVWIDIDADLAVAPGRDQDAVRAAAEDALRRWSQRGGRVGPETLGGILSGVPHLRQVHAVRIARQGAAPGEAPVLLRDAELARAGAVTVRVRYPSDGGAP